MTENEKALAEALATDLRRPYVEAVAFDVWGVLGDIAYFEKNLDKLCRKEKLPTPFNLKPISYEVRGAKDVVVFYRPLMFTIHINNNNYNLHTPARV